MARRTTRPQNPDNPATEWLSTHTLQDVRELAQELSDQGEDVKELVSAVNELEHLLEETKIQSGEAAGGR